MNKVANSPLRCVPGAPRPSHLGTGNRTRSFAPFPRRFRLCRWIRPDGSRASALAATLAKAVLCCLFALLFCPLAQAKPKAAWRQATDAELASLLPARAPVEKEHIETEMRTASGIVDKKGRYIAGVVLITAGYSADGKYSHYLVVQAPIKIGGIEFKPAEYVLGYVHTGDVLNVHFNDAMTGALIGTADAHRIAGTSRVEQLHIWPPDDKALLQIGRFGIPYEFEDR